MTTTHEHLGAPPAVGPTGHHRLLGALARRWPAWLGLASALIWLPQELAAWTLIALQGLYLVIGALRRAFTTRRLLALQLAGLAAYAALALAASVVTPQAAAVVVGAGWLVHAAWDVAHHRAGVVVPRAYAEWCAVVDTVVGIAIITAAL